MDFGVDGIVIVYFYLLFVVFFLWGKNFMLIYN